MPTDRPVERIEAFIRGDTGEDFDSLALAAFAFQHERLPEYRRLCERREIVPESVGDWRRIPPVPTLAFKTLELSTDPAREIFRSSGTTSEARSIHRHPYPGLYRATIDVAFPPAALPPLGSPDGHAPMLSLVPSREQVPDSSLGFMVDHVLDRWADSGGTYAVGPRGVDGRKLRTWLAGRQRDGRPALLLTTALALLEALEVIERLELRFRLPSGSLVFETGGYKGRHVEVTPEELEERVARSLGVPPSGIVREYGMTELTSQLYTHRAAAGPRGAIRFHAPPWVRMQALSPETLEPLAEGETGMVAILDLANVGSALHLLTEDLGAIDSGTLELKGRAGDAELRGCSLTAEELGAG